MERPSDVKKEKQSMISIVEEVRKSGLEDKAVQNMIDEHLNNFAHLGVYFYFKKPMTRQDVKRRIKELITKDLKKEKKEFEEQAKIPEKTEKIIKELKLNESDVLKIRTIREVAFGANDLDEAWNYLITKMQPLFRAIEKRLGVKYKQLTEMRAIEITDARRRRAVCRRSRSCSTSTRTASCRSRRPTRPRARSSPSGSRGRAASTRARSTRW